MSVKNVVMGADVDVDVGVGVDWNERWEAGEERGMETDMRYVSINACGSACQRAQLPTYDVM